LSAASLWEIAIKPRLGKLRLKSSPNALLELFDNLGIAIISIDEHHVLAAVEPEPKNMRSIRQDVISAVPGRGSCSPLRWIARSFLIR
jgi:hypothetical protein